MKFKLRNHFGYSVLAVTLLNFSQAFSQSQNNQYSSYSSAYATLPQDGLSSSSSLGGSGGTVSEAVKLKAVDLSTNGVADGSSEQQRGHQTVGYNPQAPGSHSMYYYEMYPAQGPKPRQRCTYTPNGMKCQLKRESAVGGQEHDSYTAAAHSAPSASYGEPMMEQYGDSSYGVMEEEEQEKGGGGDFGGLGGLVGLIGLKGLKGLKVLKPFAFLIPFLPLLLPLLPIILLPLIIIPALPIILGLILLFPVVVVPGFKRSLIEGLERSANVSSVARMATDVIESEECIERISCEIARMSRDYKVSKLLDRLVDSLPKANKHAKRVAKGLEKDGLTTVVNARGNEGAENCSRFVCKPKDILAKAFSKK